MNMAATEEDVPEGVDPKDVGLIAKYRVYKWVSCEVPECDPNHKVLQEVEHQVFVMDPTKDKAAREALRRYAQVAYAEGRHRLAQDIDNWVTHVQIDQQITEAGKNPIPWSPREAFENAMNDEGETQ
jgi:hypothetical protein